MYPNEESAVHDFFLATYTTYPDEGLQNYRAWKSLPAHDTRTYVAIAPDQSILATVVTWYRQVRNTLGTPCRVGHLSHVVTRADARRQGHASHLVDQAITAMQDDGCMWSSLLTASATGRALYERSGWRSLAMPFWRGLLPGDRPRLPETGYLIQQFDPTQGPNGWATLAAIYAEYNALRSLTVIRDEPYWATFTAAQLADGLMADRVFIFTAHHPAHMGNPCGYVLLHIYDEAFFSWSARSVFGRVMRQPVRHCLLRLRKRQRSVERSRGSGCSHEHPRLQPHWRACAVIPSSRLKPILSWRVRSPQTLPSGN
jgi:GNAT superfamily N-acetyltransferase